MTKRTIYKARVIHDPLTRQYSVQYKTRWYSKWEYRTFHGYEEGLPSTHYQSQFQALARAQKNCDSLVARQVVYETNV